MYIFFKICAKTIGLRSSAADEVAGLDIPEMGVHGYYEGNVVEQSPELKPTGAGVLGFADPDRSKA